MFIYVYVYVYVYITHVFLRIVFQYISGKSGGSTGCLAKTLANAPVVLCCQQALLQLGVLQQTAPSDASSPGAREDGSVLCVHDNYPDAQRAAVVLGCAAGRGVVFLLFIDEKGK